MPHAAAAKAWAEQRGVDMRTSLEPALRPVAAWGSDVGRTITSHTQPVVGPMCGALEAPTAAVHDWLAQAAQYDSRARTHAPRPAAASAGFGPTRVIGLQPCCGPALLAGCFCAAVFVLTRQLEPGCGSCLCLPVQKQLKFGEANEAHYLPPVYPEAKEVD